MAEQVPTKRPRLATGGMVPIGGPGSIGGSRSSDKLETRLGQLLCCAVCLDLPHSAIYQVGKENVVDAQIFNI